MLIISRKSEETLVINGNVVVHILNIATNRVKIGIDAPKEVPVLRGELLDRDERANR